MRNVCLAIFSLVCTACMAQEPHVVLKGERFNVELATTQDEQALGLMFRIETLVNVLFGTMGPTADTPDADDVYRTVKSTSAEEIANSVAATIWSVFFPLPPMMMTGLAVIMRQHLKYRQSI